jgi:nicotinamide mononucleotide (NMN) deamidase PncC
MRFRFRGTREVIREQAVQAALDLLRRKLLGLPSKGIGSEEQD